MKIRNKFKLQRVKLNKINNSIKNINRIKKQINPKKYKLIIRNKELGILFLIKTIK